MPGSQEDKKEKRLTCCEHMSWESVADLGSAAGADFDLGKCTNCGSYIMCIFYYASENYVPIGKEMAERFLNLKGTPELKKALKRWFN